MKIAITGFQGFVGNHLVKYLEQQVGEFELIKIGRINGNNINDFDSLLTVGEFDIMVHLAAQNFIPKSFLDPKLFYNDNIMGTINVLELCRMRNAKIIFMSSYVYGEPDYLPIDEKHVTKAYNPYGESKLIGESLCLAYARDFGIDTAIIRPFNVFGQGQKPNFLISEILDKYFKGDMKILLKDPNPRRDYIYIDDLISIIILLLKEEKLNSRIYNACSGVSFSVLEVTEIVNALFGNNINFVFCENSIRKNEVIETVGSYNKLFTDFGWRPHYTLQTGLLKMMESINFI